MTIQQALQTLELTGAESWETIEARYMEAYNEAQIRLVNEFDEKRMEELRTHLASLQDAFTCLQELPGSQPGTASDSTANITEKEAWELLGLYEGAPKKRIRQAYLQKKEHLEGVVRSGFSVEMTGVAQKELSRLEVAISLLNQSSGKITRRSSGFQAAIIVLIAGAVGAVGFGGWTFLKESQALPGNKRKAFLTNLQKSVADSNFIQAYDLSRRPENKQWLADSQVVAQRQPLLTGYFDQCFGDCQKALEAGNFEAAKAAAQRIHDSKEDLKSIPSYPFAQKRDELGSLLFQKRRMAMGDKNHQESGACQRIRLALFSKQELETFDWQATAKADTEPDWQFFIQEYPASSRLADARSQIDLLRKQKVATEKNQQEYYKLVRNAEGIFQTGDFQNALSVFQQAKNKVPGGKEAGNGIAKCKQKLGEIETHKRKDEETWQAAVRQDQKQAFQDYLEGFPEGKHAGEARQKIAWFEDEEAWKKVDKKSERALREYIKRYDNHDGDANELLEQIGAKKENDRCEKAWKDAEREYTVAAYKAYLQTCPYGDKVGIANQRIADIKRKNKEEEERIAEQERQRKIKNCPKCHGTFRYQTTERCYLCGGYGYDMVNAGTCSSCSGYGKKDYQCSNCSGYGKVRCDGGCGGTGKYGYNTCGRCNGYGYLLCGTCGHDGIVRGDCNSCDGSGQRKEKRHCGACQGDGKTDKLVDCYHN